MQKLVRADGRPLSTTLSRSAGHGLTPAEQVDIILDTDHINSELDKLTRFPMPKPVGYKLLLMVIQPPEKVGSVHLSEQSRDRIGAGGIGAIVLAAGPRAYTNPKFEGEAWCVPGDYVLIERYGGRQITWFGGTLLAFIDDDKIHGRMARASENGTGSADSADAEETGAPASDAAPSGAA